jgi:hypothetical protein
MNLTIDDTSAHNHFYIDDYYKLYVIENVINYDLINYNTHSISTCPSPDVKEIQYYLVVDLLHHDAFSHWVYESAIYLPLFRRLKDLYSNIKVVLKGKKTYKLLFLDFFNISPDDVVYKDISANNVCFFPSPISAQNDNAYFTENYRQIIYKFISIFHQYKTENTTMYDSVVLPRQTKENYLNNNKTYDMSSIYKGLNDKNANYKIINTDEITALSVQIQGLRSSHNIILTDGAPFLVNNMFCMHSKISIIDNITIGQFQLFKKLKYITDTCCELNNNKYTYIGTSR